MSHVFINNLCLKLVFNNAMYNVFPQSSDSDTAFTFMTLSGFCFNYSSVCLTMKYLPLLYSVAVRP